MSFEQVAAPAIDYAEHGFPMRAEHGARDRSEQLEFFESWPDNQTLLAEARRLACTSRARRSSCRRWRARCKRMVEAERAAKAKGRAAGIVAARDRFYKGDIAARDGGVPAGARARRSTRATSPSSSPRVEEPAHDDLSRLHRLQARLRQPGAGAAADAQHPRELRPAGDGLRQRRLPPHGHRGDEARVRGSRHLLRRPGVRAGAGRRAAVEGVREGARRADRSEARVDVVRRRRSAAVRLAGEGSGRTGRRTSPTARLRRRADAAMPRRSAGLAPASRRTRRTCRSSTRTATCSTRRRAAAGSAAR